MFFLNKHQGVGFLISVSFHFTRNWRINEEWREKRFLTAVSRLWSVTLKNKEELTQVIFYSESMIHLFYNNCGGVMWLESNWEGAGRGLQAFHLSEAHSAIFLIQIYWILFIKLKNLSVNVFLNLWLFEKNVYFLLKTACNCKHYWFDIPQPWTVYLGASFGWKQGTWWMLIFYICWEGLGLPTVFWVSVQWKEN